MASPPELNWQDTTPDERSMATLAHALQLIAWWIGPLIIFLIRRQSRFVSFHALQALLLQILQMILFFVLMAVFFITILLYVIPNSGRSSPDFPMPLLFVAPFMWLSIMGLSITTLVIAIVYAIKAGRGEWADYPVLGRLARKILKMAPNPGQPG